MRKIISCFGIVLLSFSAMAEHHAKNMAKHNAQLHAAIKSFDRAYTNNDVDTYFSLYANDAIVYFGDNQRVDMVAYHKTWAALIQAGGGVELNEMSDLKVQVMPGGDTAIATSFIKNRTRAADGTKSTSKAYETDVWHKINGEWKIIGLHYNVIPAVEK
ncbi:MAG: nuclear transport factor 2 family protein [Pseudomonadota bacterium]